MREPGFEEFADLWQDPADDQQEVFEALARKARRRGRLVGYADYALAAVLVGGSFVAIFVTARLAALAAGLVLIGATLWLTWKRRQLRQMATTLNTAGRADFLESSIRVTTANLRRVTLNMTFLPVCLVVGLTARFAFKGGRHLEYPLVSAAEWASSPKGMFALVLFVLFFVSAWRARGKFLAELKRLNELRQAYLDENEEDLS
jgi:hypothetical protein